jgi:hypothetical protein
VIPLLSTKLLVAKRGFARLIFRAQPGRPGLPVLESIRQHIQLTENLRVKDIEWILSAGSDKAVVQSQYTPEISDIRQQTAPNPLLIVNPITCIPIRIITFLRLCHSLLYLELGPPGSLLNKLQNDDSGRSAPSETFPACT